MIPSIPDNINFLISTGKRSAALAACEEWLMGNNSNSRAYLAATAIAKKLGNFDLMRDWATTASTIDPRNFDARLLWIESQIYCGEILAARNELSNIEEDARGDDILLQNIATLYSNCAQHADALRCYEKSWSLRPEHAPYQYNLATSAVTLGQIDRAEALFDEVLQSHPADFGALLNRSQLKTWTSGNNHVEELLSILKLMPEGKPGRSHVCYALGKEFEDIGSFDQAFAYLEIGANERRQRMSYQVGTDEAAIEAIRCTFSEVQLKQIEIQSSGAAPFFVLGLPRSGTTLVEHNLAAHSQIGTLGEIENFAFALMRLTAGDGGKQEMITRSAAIDFRALGHMYRHSLEGYGQSKPNLINKTPLNYLYLGLIRLALPESRIINLRRNPMDVCFAMFKTHFRMGYPFSYSLTDLARYYIAYDSLMAHWRSNIPGGFMDIDYEDLVDDQEESVRAIVDYCGLTWDDACLKFHAQSIPSATASASQVRQPIYRKSLNRWKSYANQLAPLAEQLTAHGIDIG